MDHQRLKITAQRAFDSLKSCCICPRKCKVNRLENEKGFCKTGLKAKVYSYFAHHGEEPPISGSRGSGTIFFSNCNMTCAYCQNYEFSQFDKGKEASDKELAGMMLELQGLGCHNINFVTPTHVMPQILKALEIAVAKGLKIPLVYNTGGYELPGMIKMLDGIIDVYLPDMRYADDEMAIKYSSAPGYPKFNREAVKEMQRQAGVAEMDKEGIVKKGVIIRLLVLPNNFSGADKTLKFIAKEISKDTYVSLMSQYNPYYKTPQMKELARRITLQEYDAAQEAYHKYGLHNGWVQESHGLDSLAGVHITPKF